MGKQWTGSRPDAIEALANVRGEARNTTEQFLAKLAERLVPRRLITPSAVNELPLIETGIDWPYAYARFDDQRIFYSYPSNATRLRQFWVVRDKLPRIIRPETFGVVADIVLRFAYHDDAEPVAMHGWNVIEAGAYIGFKAMRFARKAGSTGKVVAVEVDRTNYELMCLNVEANGLRERISPVHAGLAAKAGEATVLSDGYQKHSLASMDGLNVRSRKRVHCIKLESLIEDHSLERVDYLNIQVNGAEIDVLAGCR